MVSLHNGITLHPPPAPRQPLGEAPWGMCPTFQFRIKELKELLEVRLDLKVGPQGRLGELRWVDVYVDLVRARREHFPAVAHLPDGHARPEDEHQICSLYCVVARTVTDRSLSATPERMVAGDHVVSPRSRHGSSEPPGRLEEVLLGVGVVDAAAGDHDWPV